MQLKNSVRNVLALAIVAVLAYAAGSLGLPGSLRAAAAAPNDAKSPQPPAAEVDPKMAVVIKAGTPGEHHKVLDPLIGTFEGEVTMWMDPAGPPMKSRGTVTRQWVLDGRFIQETVEAVGDMGPYKAIGYLGYNNVDGNYEFVWMESVSTGVMHEIGLYNGPTKMMVTYGTHRDPATCRLIHGRGLFDMSDPDREVMTGWHYNEDGKEHKVFEGVFERKK